MITSTKGTTAMLDFSRLHLASPATCSNCNFTTSDINLLANHSCDIQEQGGQCEDFPCCGHERGDCNGLLYGSDEAIKSSPHVLCDHENGDCEVDDEVDDEDCGGWYTYADEDEEEDEDDNIESGADHQNANMK